MGKRKRKEKRKRLPLAAFAFFSDDDDVRIKKRRKDGGDFDGNSADGRRFGDAVDQSASASLPRIRPRHALHHASQRGYPSYRRRPEFRTRAPTRDVAEFDGDD